MKANDDYNIINVIKLHKYIYNYFLLSNVFHFKLSWEIYYVQLFLNFKVLLMLYKRAHP